MDADLNKAHPTNQLRPRLRSGYKEKMKKKFYGKIEFNSRMAIEARKQLALMNRCRMHKQGGHGMARSATKGAACLSKNQPFYAKFLNR